jgi:hypothetical protein
MFIDDLKGIKCPDCGYMAYSPFPPRCPKCNKEFPTDTKNDSFIDGFSSSLGVKKEKLQKKKNKSKKSMVFQKNNEEIEKREHSRNFAALLRMKSNPELVTHDSKVITHNPPMPESTEKMENKIRKKIFKVKEEKITIINLQAPKIELGVEKEYFRFMGIITKNREIIYSSNQSFEYLLDLASNLDYIATSILSGKLDRMNLSSLIDTSEEMCYFQIIDNLIYVLYGNIPAKKASWLLTQIRSMVQEEIRKLGKTEINKLSKVEDYNFKQKFTKRLKYFLSEYIDLQNIFTSNKIESVDKFLRVDYFGLSYQSIGVLSSLLTDQLVFQGLPTVDEKPSNKEEALKEMKEAVITAKIEAIAANCVANTNMMPQWISVQLGFQRYRFIIFARTGSEKGSYYISLLTEGNLDFRHQLIAALKEKLNILTNKPFVGILTQYYDYLPEILRFFEKININISE